MLNQVRPSKSYNLVPSCSWMHIRNSSTLCEVFLKKNIMAREGIRILGTKALPWRIKEDLMTSYHISILLVPRKHCPVVRQLHLDSSVLVHSLYPQSMKCMSRMKHIMMVTCIIQRLMIMCTWHQLVATHLLLLLNAQPISSMHFDNLHEDLQSTPSKLESVPRSQDNFGFDAAPLQKGIMAVSQHANTNNATSDTFKSGDLGGIPTFSSTQDDTGYIICMRPRIDRLVNAPERYRSPFKCISHRPAIDMVKAHAVRRKFCTELKTKLKCVMHRPTEWLTCKDVAESFEDGAQLNKSFMSYFVECIRAEEETFRPNCVGFRVFLFGYLGICFFFL